MDIRGRGILITGASRGLGAALARRLARRGARLALVAREAVPLESVAAEIRAAGGEAHAIAADVGAPGDALAIAAAAAELAGPIDVLVQSASTLGRVPLELLLDTEPEDLERVLAVNLVGPFRLARSVIGSMALRGGGLVVQVTSDAGVVAYPRWGAYGVSKAALDQLGRIWAAELEGTGVKVLTVDPGEMDTAMHRAAMPDADRSSVADPAEIARRLQAVVEDPSPYPAGARVELARVAAA